MLCSVTFCSFDMKKNQRKINLLSIIYLQSPPQFPTHCVPLSTRSYTSGTQYFCLDLLPPQIYTIIIFHFNLSLIYILLIIYLNICKNFNQSFRDMLIVTKRKITPVIFSRFYMAVTPVAFSGFILQRVVVILNNNSVEDHSNNFYASAV